MPDTSTPQPQSTAAGTRVEGDTTGSIEPSSASDAASPSERTVKTAPQQGTVVDRQWFYVAAGQRVGPIVQEVFLQIVKVGQIGPETMVWSPGLTDWVRAATMPDLSGALSEGAGPRAASMGMPRADFSTEKPSMIVPSNRSGWAIAAGYLGLFSVLGVAGPFAILCGVMGLREIKRNEGMGGKGRSIFGIVMGSLGTIGLAVFVVGMIVSHK